MSWEEKYNHMFNEMQQYRREAEEEYQRRCQAEEENKKWVKIVGAMTNELVILKEENEKLKETKEQSKTDVEMIGKFLKADTEIMHEKDDKINKLEEKVEELKEEMKWRMWGENMKGADYDIENDEEAWECVVMEWGWTEKEIKELSKYYPRPEEKSQ